VRWPTTWRRCATDIPNKNATNRLASGASRNGADN
jgi:hypothetical protein